MPTSLLYAVVILIWGATWLMVKFQVGSAVAPEVSIFYRFLLAGLLLALWCAARGFSLRFTRRQHGFLALMGLCNFCVNYILTYLATVHLPSGLVSVTFSLLVPCNALLAAFFLGAPLERRVMFGAALGAVGTALIFWPQLSSLTFGGYVLSGLTMALLGTIASSFGNIVAARNQGDAMAIFPSTAIAMLYGAGLTLLYVLACGLPFTFDWSPRYVLSFLMLVLLGSIVAFLCYFALVKNIGAARAAYAIVLCPLVALLISTVFEGYQWTVLGMAGMAAILTGNLIVLAKRQPA